MEQIATPGNATAQREIRQAGIYFREVQHPSVDAWLFRGIEHLSLCRVGRIGRLQVAESSAGEIHADCLARKLRNADPGSDHRRKRNQDRELCVYCETLLIFGNSDTHFLKSAVAFFDI